jgi:hypothetical protein
MKFFTNKKSLVLLSVICIITLSNVFCVPDPPVERKNPNAFDAAMEPIVQNTAYVMSLTHPMSAIDANQSRYSVIGDPKGFAQEEALLKKENIYKRDPEAYYPYVDTNKPVPRYEAPKLNRGNLTGESKSYYDPTGDYRVIPKFYPGKEVPVISGDTRTTFPTEANLKGLKQQMKVIDMGNKLDVESIKEKGIYYSDPKPYYDPTDEDTSEKVKEIGDKINSMSASLDFNMKNKLKADISYESNQNEVQNMVNKEAEEQLLKHKTIYTPIGNTNGITTEYAPGTNVGKNKNRRKPATVMGSKEEADVVSHVLEEADEKPKKAAATTPAAATPVVETQAEKDSKTTNDNQGNAKEGKMSNKDRTTKLADTKTATTSNQSGNVVIGTNKQARTNNLRKGDEVANRTMRQPVMGKV